MKTNFKISQFSRFLLRSDYVIQVKIWSWLKLLNTFPFIMKTIVNHPYIWILSFRLTFTALQWIKTNFTTRNLKISAKVWVCDFDQNLKMTQTSNSVPFIKKTLVNNVYIRIWSSWLTFTVLQWMKTNFKINQFSRFLLRSEYAIQVKIWNWVKIINSVPFIKKTLANEVYIRIWSFCLTSTVLQWIMTIFKISEFSRFLLRSGYAIQVKIWKLLYLLNSVPFVRKTLGNQVSIRIWSSWLTFTVLLWKKKNSQISPFSSFLLRSGYAI